MMMMMLMLMWPARCHWRAAWTHSSLRAYALGPLPVGCCAVLPVNGCKSSRNSLHQWA
jgi:hypothetical protein